MSELNKVYVSDDSEAHALESKELWHLVGMTIRGLFICETEGGATCSWKYAVPVPEQKIVEWTYETCPLPHFTVKNKKTGSYHVVTTLGLTHVGIAWPAATTFKEFLEQYDYIPDPTARSVELPCGSVE